MENLLDFFDRYVRGASESFVYDDGFRRWSYTCDQVRATAEGFARRLDDASMQPGERLVIWGENRPEWIAAFWGCMLRSVVVVPVDARVSDALLRRIVSAAGPRGVLVGDDVPQVELPPSVFVWRLRDIDWGNSTVIRSAEPRRTGARSTRVPANADTVAEIVFTSGTTAEPKGVLITHRNLVANITPIEREASSYRTWLWPFRPLRFLSLLPLSHMFGQALAMFLPPLVSATTVFIKGYNPDEVVAHIRRHRITLAVTVPRVLEMLRDRMQHHAPTCASPEATPRSLASRLWRYRQAHRLFGWKFCGFVVGGAQLEPELEDFWRRLGLVVIQGYGLTETAPIVAWNHPFKAKHGTVGAPLEGVEVRIASDGEILVRGAVVTSGYLNAPDETRSALEGGWFHTGDLGSFDESGHLLIRGRKKDVIVTAEGLNVFPEDVERVVEALAGVREAAVVARRVNGAEHVHAVLVLRGGIDAASVVREANAKLESHQRIRDFSVWPWAVLPRTEAIRKLKRYEIRQWVETGALQPTEERPGQADHVARLLARYVGNRAVGPETTLDELGLTSLDRIELTIALEERAGVTLSEAGVASAQTLSDLHRLVEEAPEAGAAPDVFAFPRWNRARPAQIMRNVSQTTWILPLVRLFLDLQVEGREHLRMLKGPAIFAANHQSHFDTPAILSALPAKWRRSMAVSMWKEYFEPHFFPERYTPMQRLGNSAIYYLVALFFNAFPLPRTEPGARHTLRYVGELVSGGFSILIFPEGHRTEGGEINPFQAGVGIIGSRLRLPVVPLRLDGLERVLHRTWRWPRRGRVRVTFGAPLVLEGDDYAVLARRVEHAVVALQPPDAARSRAPDAA